MRSDRVYSSPTSLASLNVIILLMYLLETVVSRQRSVEAVQRA